MSSAGSKAASDASRSSIARRGSKVPLRTEVLLLVPIALVVMVFLSIFVLLSYRETVRRALAEHGERAERMAGQVASRLEGGRSASVAALRGWAPDAWAAAVLDRDGVALVALGDVAERPLVRGQAPQGAPWPLPWRGGDDVVSGRVPVPGDQRERMVRIDLFVPSIARGARRLAILLPTVLVVDLGLLALLLLYLHRLVGRFDAVVARARQAGAGDDTDEVGLLLRTIDRALETLGDGPADELAAFRRAVARGLDGGVVLLDHDGAVLATSAAASSWLEIDPPSGRPPLDAVFGAYPHLVSALSDAVAGRRSVRREAVAIATAEGPRTLGLTAHPLRRDDGSSRGFLVLLADLTAARQRAERDRLADRLAHVGSLAAGVAHEMRNSLATLGGYLGLVERAAPADRGELLGEVRREVDHLNRVVADFLRFARPGSVRPESVDLLALLERCAADPGLGGAAVDVVAEPPDRVAPDAGSETWHLEADPSLLAHAMRNLVRNAIDAQRVAGAREAIGITLAAAPAGLVVTIADRGDGLAPDGAGDLFEPFVSKRPGGVGLGLAITRRIVVLHHGDLVLEPRAGGGALARVTLPRTFPPEVRSDDQSVTKGNDAPMLQGVKAAGSEEKKPGE